MGAGGAKAATETPAAEARKHNQLANKVIRSVFVSMVVERLETKEL